MLTLSHKTRTKLEQNHKKPDELSSPFLNILGGIIASYAVC